MYLLASLKKKNVNPLLKKPPSLGEAQIKKIGLVKAWDRLRDKQVLHIYQ